MEDLPPIFIKAISPGYTIDGTSNVGEFIELVRPASATSFLLTNLVLRYTNSSGNAVELFAFPEGSQMDGENLLLRFASSPESELANATYAKTLAMSAGPLELILDGKAIDSVCWTGKNDCLAPFHSANPTILVRGQDGVFSHQIAYEPIYNPNAFRLAKAPQPTQDTTQGNQPPAQDAIPNQPPAPSCQGLQFSEIFTYYQDSPAEQFIEFYNSTASPIQLENCSLRYKNKLYPLSGTVLAHNYHAYVSSDISLTKSPSTSNILELLDTDGTLIDTLTYPSQKKSTSYAKIDGIWQQTYAITKGQPNIYQQYQTCEQGKIINEATGNCVKAPEVSTPKTCDEGYFLNSATNRCNKIPAASATSIETAAGATNTGANYALATANTAATESFIALYAVFGVLIVGVIYIIFQFRQELSRLFGKVFLRFHKKPRRDLGRHSP